MNDTPPDRLAIDPRNPSYDGDALARGVRIKFKGVERRDVEEYSVSGGWIKVAAGRTRDRNGNALLVTLKGPVEPWFEGSESATVTDDAGEIA